MSQCLMHCGRCAVCLKDDPTVDRVYRIEGGRVFTMLERVRQGFYRHYKGPLYWVSSIGIMHDDPRRIVCYHSTQSAHDGLTRLRYEDEFTQWVDSDGRAITIETEPFTNLPAADDQTLRAGGYVRRFERVDPAFAPITLGARHSALAALGRSLRAKGVSEEFLSVTLLTTNAVVCAPPLSASEVEAIVRGLR